MQEHTTTFTCSVCGETKIYTSAFTTGYGYNEKHQKVCFACCGKQDEQYMLETGRIALYLSAPQDKTQPGDINFRRLYRAEVGNWPGTLKFPVREFKVGTHNIAGKRYDVWFHGPDSHVWHGVTYGDNTQICHCRRTKQTYS